MDKMKNMTILLVMFAMILAIGAFVFANGRSDVELATKDPSVLQGQVQKVVISQKDYNYYPREITVKAGQPVEITLDESLRGCLRSFSIKDFGVNEYARTPEDKITFTPNKKGTFNFACSMGMGYGKLIVE